MDSAPFPSPADAESALLARLRQGEAAAFEHLVRSHGPRMLVVARRLLRDEEEARDAVQDAFLSAFRGLGSFEGSSRLGTWLHRIAVNAALMRLRTRRAEQPIEPLLPAFLEDGHHAAVPPAWPARADALLERRENREQVRAAIDRLPEPHRSILVLRDIEELSTEEAAAALGIAAATAKVRLCRARQALRTLLEAQFGRKA